MKATKKRTTSSQIQKTKLGKRMAPCEHSDDVSSSDIGGLDDDYFCCGSQNNNQMKCNINNHNNGRRRVTFGTNERHYRMDDCESKNRDVMDFDDSKCDSDDVDVDYDYDYEDVDGINGTDGDGDGDGEYECECECEECARSGSGRRHMIDIMGYGYGESGVNTSNERYDEYRKGGYHPVSVGDSFQNRYNVLCKLGWGHFSTVWLCFDKLTESYAAIKVIKSAAHFKAAAVDEIRLLADIERNSWHPFRNRCLELYNHFDITGVNGTHQCLVFEVLGENVLSLIQRSGFQGIPLYNIKQIARQVLEGLVFLHDVCNIIHTDLKPENVLVVVDDISLRSKANQMIKRALHHFNDYVESKHASHRSRIGRCRLNMSKTAKRRFRAKIKRSLSFFRIHRNWLRLRAIDDLLLLATRGQLTPILAAAGVTGQLPFMPIDDLSILADDEMTVLRDFIADHNVGDTSSPPTSQPDCLIHSHSHSQSHSRSRSRSQHSDNSLTMASKPLANQSNKLLLHTSKSVRMLMRNPEQFIRRIRQIVRDEKDQLRMPYMKKRKAKRRPAPRGSEMKFTPSTTAEASSSHDFTAGISWKKDPAKQPCKIQVKIGDLGNGCWSNQHFTDNVQTREYRAVEVILGNGYDRSADIWSAACLFWEMATGEYLFDPRVHFEEGIDQDEAHVANIIETCGPIPKWMIKYGGFSGKVFTSNGKLRSINRLIPRSLASTLHTRFLWPAQEASEFASFLMPMLDVDPFERVTAKNALKHPWLKICGLGDDIDNTPVE